MHGHFKYDANAPTNSCFLPFHPESRGFSFCHRFCIKQTQRTSTTPRATCKFSCSPRFRRREGGTMDNFTPRAKKLSLSCVSVLCTVSASHPHFFCVSGSMLVHHIFTVYLLFLFSSWKNCKVKELLGRRGDHNDVIFLYYIVFCFSGCEMDLLDALAGFTLYGLYGTREAPGCIINT